ncbi:MAG: hypothetical protein GX971_09920 [Firmicutes bacterium]|jgi:hypothetical protein|nr:hypothetical protein [Bacillota bacterium]
MDNGKLFFSAEVSDKIKSYVYRLIDPRNGETFYVGKGKGNRVFDHIKSLKSANLDILNDKLKVINDIKSAGLEVIHVIHRHGLSDDMAKEVEAALIDAYPGTTNEVGGFGSIDFGPMNAIEIINKYTAPEAELKHKVIMISINRSLSDGQDVYNATRFAWVLSKSRAEKAEYILAVKQGIIVEVFLPDKWMEATKDNFPEFGKDIEKRYGFIGNVADDIIRELYKYKRVPDKYRAKGASNPIKYNYTV